MKKTYILLLTIFCSSVALFPVRFKKEKKEKKKRITQLWPKQACYHPLPKIPAEQKLFALVGEYESSHGAIQDAKTERLRKLYEKYLAKDLTDINDFLQENKQIDFNAPLSIAAQVLQPNTTQNGKPCRSIPGTGPTDCVWSFKTSTLAQELDQFKAPLPEILKKQLARARTTLHLCGLQKLVKR